MAQHKFDSTAGLGAAPWELPPLILHPFADPAASARLLENTRTALMVCGLAPSDGQDPGELARRLLDGRFSEIRMLYFLGKDLVRWMEQCMETAARLPESAGEGIFEQSFAELLTQHPPEAVSLKLRGWGVADANVIFARAIALHRVFQEPPERDQLTEEFIRHYHRYADHLFACWSQLAPHREITRAQCHFELYASGEYTKMLENEWGEG
jgi:hypothetical protein